MTSPEFIFRSHFPKATIEGRTEKRGVYVDYFVVFAVPEFDDEWSGIGDTRDQAWADACERCNLTAVKEPDTHGLTSTCSRRLAATDWIADTNAGDWQA